MTTADTTQAPVEDVLCPLLGVVRDPHSRFDRPTPAHACYAGKPSPIALEHQAAYCLSGAYESCPRFIKATGLAPAPLSPDARAGSVSLTMLTAALVALALVGVTAALAVASGVVNWPLVGGPLAVAPSPSPTAAAIITDPPTLTTPAAKATLSPTPAVATPAATASPSPAAPPTPTPAPTPRIHVVERGETLIGIARLYGIPWQLIAQANDIEDPSLLYAGHPLVIPAPGEQPLGRVHYVQRGETINQIANLYGVSPAELAEANGIEDWNVIYAGQPLIIPGR